MEKLDVVYIAPDMGSLFGAISLAAGGLKVLIVKDELVPQTLDDGAGGEVVFPMEPFLWRGLRTGAFLEPLLNRLKLLISARSKVERLDPPLQVISYNTRLDFFDQEEPLMKELTREFGEESATRAYEMIGAITERARATYDLVKSEAFPQVPQSFAERLFRRELDCSEELEDVRGGSFSDMIRASGVNGDIRLIFSGILAAMGIAAGGSTPLAAAATVLDSVRRGLFRADMPTLRKMLYTKFKKEGGYTLPMKELESVELGRNGIDALRLAKSSYLQSRLYVAPESRIIEYLPPDLRLPEKSRARLHKLFILARDRAVPVGMRGRLAVINRRAEPLYPEHVTRISVNEMNLESGEKRVCFVVESVSPGGIESIESELWDSLRGLAPFVDDYVISSKFETFDTRARETGKNTFLDLPVNRVAPNLLPTESDLLADMGLGEGIISGRVLSRLILRKLGLRVDA